MENLNLIRKIAWAMHKKSGHDWEDLFSEASYEYLKLMERYDPNKAALSTFMWTALSNSLKNYLAQYYEKDITIESLDDTDVYERPSDNPPPFWEGLSRDAQRIARMILCHSHHFVCLNPEQVRQRIIEVMTHPKVGWALERTEAGITELEAAFSR